MSTDVRLLLAFSVALVAALLLTPLARRLAVATGFLDHPSGYKEHAASTPYLGGSAVMVSFLVAVLAFAGGLDDLALILGCTGALAVVGVADDRRQMGVAPRLGAQVLAAIVIWHVGLGWDLFGGTDTLELPLTLVWVVGLVNAFNLMDNLDGATGTVAAVSALGAGLLAADQGAVLLGAFSVALAGACLGFLRYNLAVPSRIFLGDGGSMPIGFLLAVIVMQVPHPGFGWITLLAAAPIVGLVILDTTLVVISRVRRGAPVLNGARDHLSHRLLGLAGTPQRVAAVLAAAQALLCCVGAFLYRQEEATVLAVGGLYLVLAFVVIAVLEVFSAGPALARERVVPGPARELI